MSKNKELEVRSTNLQIQLTQQKEKYLQAVDSVKERSLKPLTEKVIEAAFALQPVRYNDSEVPARIGDFKIGEDENELHYGYLVEMVSKWRLICGAMKDVSVPQLEVEARHIYNAHGNLTINEVSTAIQFMVDQKLGITLPDYINFSCVFISKVLNAYENVKEELISKIIPVVEKNSLISPPEPTIAEKLDTMRYMIKECKRHADKGFQQVVFNQTVYSFLKKTGRIEVTDEMRSEARKYADRQYAIYAQSQPLSIQRTSAVMKKEAQQMIKMFGVDYCLLEYFKQYPTLVDMEGALNEIKEADYEKYLIGKRELEAKVNSLQAHCKLCNRLTGPAHHKQCPNGRQDEEGCAWYIETKPK